MEIVSTAGALAQHVAELHVPDATGHLDGSTGWPCELLNMSVIVSSILPIRGSARRTI